MRERLPSLKLPLAMTGLFLVTLLLFCADILFGGTPLEAGDVVRALFGEGTPESKIIVMEFRLPRALTAVIAGAALSVSGLLMQTLFRNPLAGPDVLGISSGAGLGSSTDSAYALSAVCHHCRQPSAGVGHDPCRLGRCRDGDGDHHGGLFAHA